jgi:YggT family protein
MNAAIDILRLALMIYAWVIVARALMSWLPLRPGTLSYRVHAFLYDVTEPYLKLFRPLLKPLLRRGAAIDVTPLVGLLVLFVVQRLLALV